MLLCCAPKQAEVNSHEPHIQKNDSLADSLSHLTLTDGVCVAHFKAYMQGVPPLQTTVCLFSAALGATGS